MARKSTLTRLPADLIGQRREHVRRLDLIGATIPTILATLQASAAHLIDDQANPAQTIRDDLDVIRARAVDELSDLGSAAPGARALVDYIALKRVLLSNAMAMAESPALAPRDRAKFLQVASVTADDIARARGVPVDRPAFNINFQQQLLALGLPAEMVDMLTAGPVRQAQQAPLLLPPGAGGGIVDAVTFGISPEFCNLPTLAESYPMQERVLRDFMSPRSLYRVLVLVCGMRSGKGVVGSVVAWYAAYQLLSLADPQRYYGLAPGQEIQIVTMATSQDQAKRNVFKHIVDRLETGGAWFQALRAQAEVVSLEIRLPKNILIRCGHSKASTQVGSTSFLVILDELARMKDTEGRDNADEVYDKMSATTATFPEHGKVLVLTSPEWEGDKSMRLLEEATAVDQDGRQINPDMMGLQLATWEANLNLSEDALAEAFHRDANPMAFWRDFGARPPLAAEGYYPDPSRWDRQADPDLRHPYDENEQLADWWLPCCDSRRYVHIDLGAKRDACGLSMAHAPVAGCPYYKTIMQDGQLVENPRARAVVVDMIHQLVPGRRREMKGEVSFETVRQMIRDWQDRGFKIKGGLVSYDGWQSLDSRQLLKREGYKVAEFSLDRNTEGHDTLQELINTDRLAYYAHAVLIAEGKRLMLVHGKKVDHPKGGCFTGDTRIALLDGSNPTIAELAARGPGPYYVFTMGEDGITVGVAHSARLTSPDAEIIELTLDRFDTVRCTPDHRFRLLDGQYKEARALLPADRLAPLYRAVVMEGGWQGYVRITCPVNGRRMVHDLVGQWKYGPKPVGMLYHHLDNDGMNNDPANVDIWTEAEHARYHTTLRHKTDPGYNLKVRLGAAAYARSEGGRQKSRETILANMPKLLAARRIGPNHRVVRITAAGRASVYDLTVEGTSNFALSAGVFVHNSKDVVDAVAGAVYHALKHGGRIAFVG